MWRPDLWLALIRVAIGAVALVSAQPKFRLGWLSEAIPYPDIVPTFLVAEADRFSELTATTPFPWHRDLLERAVIPNAALTATLEAWAELLTGVGLILGLLTGLAALLGVVLAGDAALAAYVSGTGPQPLHWVMVAAMLAFFGARAGRTWGLDAVLRRRASATGKVLLALVT